VSTASAPKITPERQVFTLEQEAKLRANAEQVMLAVGRRAFPGQRVLVDWDDRDAVGGNAAAGLDADGEQSPEITEGL